VRRKVPRELQPLIQAARDDGWRLEMSGGGHFKLRHGSGQSIVMPATPSDSRSMANAAALIRRKLRGVAA
jgi:hypothetical protein